MFSYKYVTEKVLKFPLIGSKISFFQERKKTV